METLPEEILTEILARLPLRNIYRFKTVSKTSKSLIESVYFRRQYVSLHKNSNSWSLKRCTAKELIRFYRCSTWKLPKSLALWIPYARVYYSSGLVLIRGYGSCFVGNPVLQEWIKIPPRPDGSSNVNSLVTRVDEDGVVLSFKVVSLAKLASIERTSHNLSCTLSMFLYSSETGLWTSKIIHCAHEIADLHENHVTADGTIYYSKQPGVVVAHDLYSESDQFRVIHLPDHNEDENQERVLTTTSGRYFMCMRTSLAQKEETVLKVWRLNNDDDSWQLLSKTHLPGDDYVPTAMHPFDSQIVYLWSKQNRHTVSCNLRTKKNTFLGDEYNQEDVLNKAARVSVELLQFMLPRWMEPMPRPPHIEMIDTTSLVSDPSLRRKRYRLKYTSLLSEPSLPTLRRKRYRLKYV